MVSVAIPCYDYVPYGMLNSDTVRSLTSFTRCERTGQVKTDPPMPEAVGYLFLVVIYGSVIILIAIFHLGTRVPSYLISSAF